MKWNIKSPRQSSILFDDFLTSRNIKDIEKFTSRRLEDLRDPYDIPFMDEAVTRVLKAVKDHEKIYVYGDFDVDGTAATATVWSYLTILGANVMPFIPNRVDEGYGMSEKTLTHLKEEGAQLVISVDCGIRDVELTEIAKKMGLEIIITDHHEFVQDENGNPVLPKTIVLHSKHPDSNYDTVLSGGATAWKLICGIEKKLTGEALTERTLYFMEYATLTTITDIMPLIGENRIIVNKGIEFLRNTKKQGLNKLFNISGIDKNQIDTYHIGFMIGPRLNAPGRVDNSAMDSLRLLCTTNETQAAELAKKLDDLNKTRQEWTAKYMQMAIDQVDLSQKVLFINGKNWPEGIIGLVAGKLAEKFGRPVLVSTLNTKEGKITGSARAGPGNVHIVDVISGASQYLSRYGGHKAAAGFALKPENLELFRKDLFNTAEKKISLDELEPVVNIDMEADCNEIDMKLVDQLESLSPYGNSNPTPIFSMKNIKVIDVKKLGKNQEHLKLKVCDNENTKYFDAISFNYDKDPVVIGDSIDIAFSPKKNEWNGNVSVQLEIKDVKII